MSKKRKCLVMIEDEGGMTVRKGNDIAELLSQAIRDHVDDPLVMLAVVTACVSADDAAPPPEDMEECNLLTEFSEAARNYAQKVTARWDAEAEAEMEQCQGCPDCCFRREDDRDRLLEEELRAARDGGDLSKQGEQS